MKKYRLKKEAVPFFADKLATAIYGWDVWNEYHVDDKALEEVEEAYVDYDIRDKNGSGSLGGWSDKDGCKLHFTTVFPSMKYQEYDKFSKGKMVRELMNRIQSEVNRFMTEFYNEKK